MLNIPPSLAAPTVVDGHVISKVMLDLTVYLSGPTELELEYLIELYDRSSPPAGQTKFKIAELDFWPLVSRPPLTQSARAVAAAGVKRPYIEASRQRIRDGRGFEVQFWDDRPISDPAGSWSFNCQRIYKLSSGQHAFVRFLFPLSAPPALLRSMALAIADNVAFESGHGGLVFVYDPWYVGSAFDAIYAQARRFWGVDVEYLNDTLPLMKSGIKGINWITMLGNQHVPHLDGALAQLSSVPGVSTEPRRAGVVLVAGAEPVVGDQHRAANGLDPYIAAAKALEPLLIKQHPDFPGERFINNGNTMGWIRRFVDPAGWR